MNSFWRNKDGKIIILQKPNFPLIVWFVSYLATKLPVSPYALNILSIVSFCALFVWALMEIFSGVNLFRRFLGVVVVVVLISRV